MVVPEDAFLLNLLDPAPSPWPLQQGHMDLLLQYVEAFFNRPLTVVQTPKTHVSPAGASALREKVNRPLRIRRTTRKDHIAYNISDMIECLAVQRAKGGGKDSIGPFDCIAVLALTSQSFFHHDGGLAPKKALPNDLLTKYSYSDPKLKVGVCTVANLRPPVYRPTTNLNRFADDKGVVKTQLDRILLRRLLMLIPHELCRMLGMKKCNHRRCLCYKQPFNPETWSLLLCPQCEGDLAIWIGGERGAEEAARNRLQQLEKALVAAEEAIGPEILAFGHRRHGEFEKEIDWHRGAYHDFEARCAERKQYTLRSTGEVVRKKRGVRNLIAAVHSNAPSQTLTRTLSLPDLKRHCLLDMTTPEIRDAAPLGPWRGQGWPDKVMNAKHSTGGHHVELGGSLNPKNIGGFSLGLNSSTLKAMKMSEK
eukprot:GEMP01027896.1.p1 GENE.GEMP01027896.1~~GEMP01027896.1.p1  ORF type:complete len:422 (+),score=94.47 GEMP01027896.1:176-1441(+)